MDWQDQWKLKSWLWKIRNKEPLAVVLGASVNGLSFVRSLGRRGIPTLLLDSEPLIGTYTRYSKVLLLPPVEEKPEAWVEFLDFAGSHLVAPGILFGTSDAHCVFMAEQADVLSRQFHFIVPNREAMESIVNKRAQYCIAEAAGIPIPKSYFPQTAEEVRRLATDLVFPCILKPYKAHVARKKASKKVAVMSSAEELVTEYERIVTRDVRYMIQEIIPGEDTALFGYLAFWDAEGCERQWLTRRKLRQFPPRYGDGSLQITVEEPRVAELSRRLLKAFNYRGLVGVEFKFDARDQTYRLMEINPRTVSGNQLAVSAGVDFPWIAYRYLTGSNIETAPGGAFRAGVKYVNEEWDFKAYLALRKTGGLTLRDWLRSVRHSSARAIGAWDDPFPLIVVFWRFLRAFFRDLRARACGDLKNSRPYPET